MKTFEEATEFVLKHKVVTVFGSKGSPHPSLWDNTDLSADKPKGGGWSPRVSAVWDWKTRIPETFPDEIFYGKLPNGDAVLMEREYLRTTHYPQAFKPVSELPLLCQQIYECVRIEPWTTTALRKHAVAEFNTTKSRFDTALKKLQSSLNIARSMDPECDGDTWIPFSEANLDIVEAHPELQADS
ncbi:AlkZ-related protein [Cerasicoccus fimbriatus]|uniref:AlkZ-related protein n=1 Tax=Cerasicoccus fimbriatus TaxID=3014554 RepID=UPI0022B58059|nr:hypothetical protein [Cerasicoccus sp. TK19100]